MLCVAVRARAERAKVIEGVDAGAMAVLPEHFNGVVSYASYALKDRSRDSDETALRAMPLAHGTGTIAPKVCLIVLAYMAIRPRNAHLALRFNMVDLRWNWRCHEVN